VLSLITREQWIWSCLSPRCSLDEEGHAVGPAMDTRVGGTSAAARRRRAGTSAARTARPGRLPTIAYALPAPGAHHVGPVLAERSVPRGDGRVLVVDRTAGSHGFSPEDQEFTSFATHARRELNTRSTNRTATGVEIEAPRRYALVMSAWISRRFSSRSQRGRRISKCRMSNSVVDRSGVLRSPGYGTLNARLPFRSGSVLRPGRGDRRAALRRGYAA